MDDKRAAFGVLMNGVLHQAFADPALQPLAGKVAAEPTGITDGDFDAARAAGFTDDQIFEVVVAAAVGEAARRYDSALAALDEAAAG